MSVVQTSPLEGIAIIGMAGRFPGAGTIDEFWQTLVEGRETISTFDRSTLPAEEPGDEPDYVSRRGIIDRPDWFDASFFKIAPREAEAMDPQQRIFLEACWHALENAGCDPEQFAGAIGVFAGMSNNSWLQHRILPNHDLRAQVGYENAMICNEKDYLATRTAYKLNLRGPALNIYTACSTSLVAVCQAVQALQSFQCDAALAGGVSVKWPQERGYTAQEGSIYSPDGHCRPYDAAASGTVFSNGVGVVLLKRLEDAVRDGDHIWAVIKGAALNNDGGAKVSFTAPSPDGHTEVISLAHALAGFEPDSIGYVEGHGTATPIGDPIEVAGLTKAFRQGTERTGFCGLGSLKSNMGHMDAASGVAGLIKTALALHHRQIPPTLHFTRPNPALQLAVSPFFVVDKLMPWDRNGHPRRAGVSSFGVGGTNAHVVLEEAPQLEEAPVSHSPQIIVVSAKSSAALEAACGNLSEWLSTHQASLADVAWTLQTGRRAFAHRRALVASSAEEAMALLRDKTGITAGQNTDGVPVVLLFPGQGAQHLLMGAETYEAEPVFREAFDLCAGLFEPLLSVDLRRFLFPGADECILREKLNQTRFTQPALFAVEYALAVLLRSWGITPAGMLGHSIGEYVAATLAGALKLEDAVNVIAARARIMDSQESGSMLAVRLPEAELAAKLPATLDIAAINGPAITVVSGPAEEIAAFGSLLEMEGISARVLHTSHAFHSRMMDPALEAFRKAWEGVTLHAPQSLWTSNLTGREITTGEAISVDYWVRHLRSRVRFADGIAALAAQGRCIFVECGPGTSLAPLVRQHPAANGCQCVSLFPPSRDDCKSEYRTLLTGIGKLWTSGAVIDWRALHNTPRRRVPLPGYPFERQRFCPDTLLPAGTRRDGEGWLTYPEYSTASPPPDSIAQRPVSDAPALSPPAPYDRIAHLIGEVRSVLHRASGIDITAADPSTQFLDLGFDSLFLTQASLALKKHFGIKITFRQLMEHQSSIGELAAWLDEKLPPDSFAPVTPVAVRNQNEINTPAPGNDIDGRLSRIESALAKLTGTSAYEPQKASGAFTVAAREQTGSDGKRIAFGPFRPVEKRKEGGLTSLQQAHLTKLIADYCARYPRSRQFTADHRAVFADPRAVGGFNPMWKDMVFPAVTDRSEGAYLWDIDGNRWIDVVHGFGSGFFGHKPAFVVDAIKAQLDRGYEIGPTSPLAGEVARMVCEFSGKERVAFCNTGSEALMAAIRVSRTITGRDRIAMFAGAYHGIFDEVLARPLAANGELRSIPIAPGIPEGAQANIIVLEYGHPESLEIIRRHGHELAAVLVEPVPSRRPDIAPVEFVRELRRITAETGTALVFDEVVLGFRTHPQGAQYLFGVDADLVSYGKVIGGGMPLGVLAGSARFMDALDGGAWQYGDESAPEVGVTFFAGTFIRHPLTMAAARAVLCKLKEEGPALQTGNDAKAATFVQRLDELFREHGVPVRITRYSSLWMLHADPALKHFSLLFYHLRLRGIHIWEGRGNFISLAHTEADLDSILTAFRESVQALQEGGFFPSGDHSPASPAMPESLSLTPAQHEMFLASQLSAEASLSCHESLTLDLTGTLRTELLGTALNALVARHDALRAGFDAGGPEMIIHPQATLPLRFSDLSGNDASARLSLIEAATAEEFLTPFDLSCPPLLRVLLLKTAEERHQLIITAHHLVCDGWSLGVLMHELPAVYRHACGERTAALPAPQSYADYSAARQKQREAGDFDNAAAYWREQFVTIPMPLQLPSIARRADTGLHADTLSAEFPPALAGKLRSFCREYKATPYVTLLASWNALLSRLSGSADMVIGTPMANQPVSGYPGLVGHAVQFLPLRLKTNLDATCADHLGAVRDAFLSAQENQDCTLGELLGQLPHLRADERRGFVRTTFTLEPATESLTLAPDLTGGFHANSKRRLLFELSNFVFTEGEHFRVVIVWRESLFDRRTIEHWLACWFNLLEAFLTGPAQSLAALPLLSVADRSVIVHQFNTSGCAPCPQRCIHELFEEVASRRGEAVALMQGAHVVSYRELNARANRIAWYLRAQGVGPETAVAIFAEKSVELVTGLLAILKAGGAYVPIDVSYPQERVANILNDSGAGLLLVRADTWAALPPGCTAVVLDDPLLFAGESGDNPPSVSRPEHLAYIIYTSGSTGLPKGSPVPHRGVVRLVKNQNFAVMDEEQTFLLASAISFDASTFELWAPLLNGGRLALMPSGSFSLEAVGEAIRRHQVTTLWLTSGLFSLMVDERLDDLRPLRQLLTGGDIVSASHAARVLKELPHLRLINGYGPTENTTFTCCHTITAADCERGTLPIGRPVAHTQCYIVDPLGQPVPIGVTGELLAGGAGLAHGYWNRDELTAEKFIPDTISGAPDAKLYRTGDLCRWLPDGTIEFLGRADTQLKIRGFRIEPAEVELALMKHPSVQRCCAVAHGADASSKRLIACVVLNPELPATDESIREFIRPQLPHFMMPALVIVVPALPVTPNGKIDIRALPDPGIIAHRSIDDGDCAGPSPSSDVEKRLARLWQEVLECNSPGLESDFFQLGGTSLQGLRLFTKIRQEFSRSLPLGTLYDAPTLGSMARVIAAATTAPMSGQTPVPHVKCVQPHGTGAPLFLIHGGDGGALFFRSLLPRLGSAHPVWVIESPALTDDAWLLARHSIETCAAAYLKMIRCVHPSGTFIPGGYSYGGVVAYEMARLMEAAGEPVEQLVLFDTENPSEGPRHLRLTERIAAGWRQGGKGTLSRIRHLGARFGGGLLGRFKHAGCTATARTLLGKGHAATDSETRTAQIHETHVTALHTYAPGGYGGSMLLLRSDAVSDKYERAADYNWTGYVRELKIVRVPGDHLVLFDEPWVTGLSEALRGELEAQESQPRPASPAANAPENFTAPLPGTETTLAGIWESVLGSNHIGRESDFFSIGGTSLTALRVIERVQRKFSVNLPLGALFDTPSLCNFAARIDSAAGAPQEVSAIT